MYTYWQADIETHYMALSTQCYLKSLQGFANVQFVSKCEKKPIKGLWIVDYHMMSSVVSFCFLVFCSCLFCFCFMYFFSERAHVWFWEHDKLLLRLREENMGGILPLPVFSELLSQPYFNLQYWMEIYRGMCWSLD